MDIDRARSRNEAYPLHDASDVHDVSDVSSPPAAPSTSRTSSPREHDAAAIPTSASYDADLARFARETTQEASRFVREKVDQAAATAETGFTVVGRSKMTSSASASHMHPTDAVAAAAFSRQAARLADVNHWNSMSGAENARFALYAADGRATANRPAGVGDFIRIRLPGQLSADWVRIENVEASPDRVAITVRPSYDPTKRPLTPTVTAHFFSSAATNTFSLERKGTEVTARVEGRNESANVGPSAGSLPAMARNRAVCESAWGLQVPVKPLGVQVNGMQQHQWNVFTGNLVDDR